MISKPVATIIVLCFLSSLCLKAQEAVGVDLDLLKMNYSLQGFSLLSLKAELDHPSIDPAVNKLSQKKTLTDSPQATVYLPKAWCFDDLAVFCKLEVKLEKSIKLPVKFRIGEVNYAEMREGKPYSPSFY